MAAEQATTDKLMYWRERLMEHDRGLTNKTMTRTEITGNLDYWLDRMLEEFLTEELQALADA